jgi:hypothetical protein
MSNCSQDSFHAGIVIREEVYPENLAKRFLRRFTLIESCGDNEN